MGTTEKKRLYDRNELLGLLKNERSCVILKRCSRRMVLQPKYLLDVKEGVKKTLDSGLLKFDQSLKGFLLDYRNLVILTDKDSGKIVGRYGEFIVVIKAAFFVFQPEIGYQLEGIVNVKSDTHIGCLVHKIFNARILKPDDEEFDEWECKDLEIGDRIAFDIVDNTSLRNLPCIQGKLLERYPQKAGESQLSKNFDSLSVNHSQEREKKKKHETLNKSTEKISDSVVDSLHKSNEFEGSCREESLWSLEKHSPKKTLKKEDIGNSETLCNDTEGTDSSKTPKKKKKKKEKDKDKEKNEDTEVASQQVDSTIGSSEILSSTLVPRKQVSRPELDELFSPILTTETGKVEDVRESDGSRSVDVSSKQEERLKKKKRKHEAEDLPNKSSAFDRSSTHVGNGSVDNDASRISNVLDSSVDKIQREKSFVKESPGKNTATPKAKNKEFSPKKTDTEKLKQSKSPGDRIERKRARNETPSDKSQGLERDSDGFMSPPNKKMALSKSISPKVKAGLEESLFSDFEESMRSPIKSQRLAVKRNMNEVDFASDDGVKENCEGKTEAIEDGVISQGTREEEPMKEKSKGKKRKMETEHDANVGREKSVKDSSGISPKKRKKDREEVKGQESRSDSMQLKVKNLGTSKASNHLSANEVKGESKVLEAPKKKETDEKKPAKKSRSRKTSMEGESKKTSKKNLLNELLQSVEMKYGLHSDERSSEPVASVEGKEKKKKRKKEKEKETKKKKKKDVSESSDDDERSSLIEDILKEARATMGFDEDEGCSVKKNKSSKKTVEKAAGRVGSTDSGFTSNADRLNE